MHALQVITIQKNIEYLHIVKCMCVNVCMHDGHVMMVISLYSVCTTMFMIISIHSSVNGIGY